MSGRVTGAGVSRNTAIRTCQSSPPAVTESKSDSWVKLTIRVKPSVLHSICQVTDHFTTDLEAGHAAECRADSRNRPASVVRSNNDTYSKKVHTPRLLPDRLLLDKPVPGDSAATAVEHLHELALLTAAHALEVDANVLEPADLLADGEGGRVDAAHEGADELAAEALEVGLEGEQLVVVLDQDALVAHRLLAHVLQQQAVALVLLDVARPRAQDARPQGRQQVRVDLILRVGLAHHRARQVEELVVDALKKPEQCQAVLQLVVDGLLQDSQELVEGALQGLARALRVGHAEDGRRDGTDASWRASRRLEQAGGGEHRVNVVKGRRQGRGWERGHLGELATSPVHHDQDAIL